jgi:hypothetical protein
MKGLRFHKLDLHIHTPASKDFNRPDGISDDDIAASIVRTSIEKGLDGIAITDHNSAVWIDRMREAAVGTPLVVFPGVEITATGGKTGGIHVIALFDPSKNASHVADLLSKLDLAPEDHGKETTVVNRTPDQVVEMISRVGALPVLAHANSSRGLLHDMTGESRIKTIQNPLLMAVEGTDFDNADKKATRKRVFDLLDGTDPNYKTKLAVYQSSDNLALGTEGGHCVEGIAGRSTFFKMERIDLASLRNCFEDPDVRIRHLLDESERVYPRIAAIQVTGGFLDELGLDLHSGLNTIIGGKGTGKSLLIEFLRFALAQPSTNPNVNADYESKLAERLNTYGSVAVKVVLETGQEIELERQFNPQEGNPFVTGPDVDVGRLFPVLFLSQNEIIRVAESEREQLVFIDRFFDFQSHVNQISQLEKDLKLLDKQFADSIRALIESDELKRKIATIETEIKGIDVALKNPTFEKFAKLEAKQNGLAASTGYSDSLIGKIDSAARMFLDVPTPAYSQSVAEDPAIKRAEKIVSDIRTLVANKFQELSEALQTSRAALVKEEQETIGPYSQGKQEYEELVRASGGNYQAIATKRLRLIKELEGLQTQYAKFREQADKAGPLNTYRNATLDKLAQGYAAYGRERRTKCKRFEIESGGKLKIGITESSNVDVFKTRMAELKRGSYLRDADIETVCEKVTPRELIQEILRFAVRRFPAKLQTLANKAEVEVEWLSTLANYLLDSVALEDLLELQYRAVPRDRPDIQYRLSDGAYAPLARVSVGQKCTAMLIMALSDGNMPIVIDQPEDSLDIKTVWDDVCVKLRKGKDCRQFIFTTHNSSLAVASDTDYYVIMEADASKGEVKEVGAMDHEPINTHVLEHLEGGIDTYKRKYVKYDAERRFKP